MRRRLLSLGLAMVMCLSLAPGAFAAGDPGVDPSKFTDVPANAWYWDELDYALYNGYTTGASDITFLPDEQLTRAQFVTMLGRVGSSAAGSVYGYTSTAFSDVDMGSWYGPSVEWARDKGIVNGVSATRFAPHDTITVEQLGVMLYHYVGLIPRVPLSTPVTYADASSISSWAAEGMEWMAKYDLLPTDASRNVHPRQPASRAYCVAALARMARLFGIGVEPAPMREAGATTAEAEAQKVHDALWASGELHAGMTEKEKAIVYYKWMCMNTSYDGASGNYGRTASSDRRALSHSALNAFLNGKAVCDGLAKAYLCLLKTEGISCRMGASFQQNHAWAIATLDGVEYDPIDVSDVGFAREPDGSFSEFGFDLIVEKYFYPDAYEAKLVPFE